MAISAQGTVLAIESATAGTYTTIGEVTGWQGPTQSYTVLDPTNIADTVKRKGLGLMDPGEVSIDLRLNYGDAGQNRVRTQFAAGARCLFRITVPAGALGSGASSTSKQLAFGGYLTRVSLGGRMDSLAEGSIAIAIDSAITET